MDANLVALIVGLAAATPGVYAIWSQRHKLQADSAEKWQRIADQAADRITKLEKSNEDLSHKLDNLESRLAERDRQVADWAEGINRLCSQVVSLGHTPVWRPKEIKAQ